MTKKVRIINKRSLFLRRMAGLINSDVEWLWDVGGVQGTFLRNRGHFSFWIILDRRFRWVLYTITISVIFFPLLYCLVFGRKRGFFVTLFYFLAELAHVLVEFVVVPPQLMSFLFEVLVIVFEVFVTNLAVIGGRSEVVKFLGYLKKYGRIWR